MNVRIIRPDVTRRTNARETCPPPESYGSGDAGGSYQPAAHSRADGASCEPAYFKAGINPNSRLEKSDTANANSMTEASIAKTPDQSAYFNDALILARYSAAFCKI